MGRGLVERVSNCNVFSTDCERSSLGIGEGSYLGAGGDKAQQTDWAQIVVLMAPNWWAECSHCRVLSKEIHNGVMRWQDREWMQGGSERTHHRAAL